MDAVLIHRFQSRHPNFSAIAYRSRCTCRRRPIGPDAPTAARTAVAPRILARILEHTA